MDLITLHFPSIEGAVGVEEQQQPSKKTATQLRASILLYIYLFYLFEK